MSKPILAAILSCSGTELSDDEKYLLSEYNPLGVTLFSRNLKNEQQAVSLVQSIRDAVNRDDVLIAIDEEGGRVSRLNSIQTSKYASAEELGKASVEYARMQAELISCDLRKLGVNVNYAPVIDRKNAPQNPVLLGRCFDSDEKVVTEYAKIMADTYIQMGICPCVKHIPGHLNAVNDPHLHLMETQLSFNEIKKETAYLQNFNVYPLAMTSHIMLPSIDKDYPATLSKKVISQVIRSHLGFDGFLISDAIEMHALPGNDMAQKTCRGLDAGLDAICYCAGKVDDMRAICQEKRFMPEKSLIRFAKIKNVIHNTPKCINVADIRKRYEIALQDKLDVQYEYDATEVLFKMQKIGEDK